MKNKLNRTLNLVDITLATSGYIIGAGIYAILGIATKYGKQYTWIAILISGLFSICTGLSFSELSTIYNKNGTEYYIAKDVFNNQVATIISFITILFPSKFLRKSFSEFLSISNFSSTSFTPENI